MGIRFNILQIKNLKSKKITIKSKTTTSKTIKNIGNSKNII